MRRSTERIDQLYDASLGTSSLWSPVISSPNSTENDPSWGNSSFASHHATGVMPSERTGGVLAPMRPSGAGVENIHRPATNAGNQFAAVGQPSPIRNPMHDAQDLKELDPASMSQNASISS